MALVGGVLLVVAAHFYFDRVSATPDLRAEVEDAIGWLGLALPLSLTSGVLPPETPGATRPGDPR